MTDDDTQPGRVRGALRSPATRWLAASIVLIVAVGGLWVWTQIKPLVTSVKNEAFSYAVPSAPRLVANPGETVYRIDPTQSKVTYGVDENIVGQTAGRATGSTSGIAGDLALNSADPAASRIGQIVVDVEQLHSDNNLRDARIRQDFLESHDNPLVQFDTDSLTGMPAAVTPGQSASFTMNGRMTVKGETRPVSWTVDATVDGDQVKATATTTVKMSDLGIGPISLAGLVKTGDDVTLTIDLVALDPSKTTVPDQIASPVTARSGSGPSFKREVAPILAANCASCHATGQVGAEHWTFETAGDAAKVADGIGTVTQARYMPPWPASDVGVPLAHSKTLSQQDIDTIVAWSQAGGHLDEPEDTPIEATPTPGSVQPRHDITLQMPDAYTGSTDTPNDYRCFVLDPKITEPTYLTGYEVTPGVRTEIHHVQVFHINAGQAAEGRAISGSDGKPGWSCYSGPNLPDKTPRAAGARRSSGFTGQPGLIAGWVPGQDPSVYPDNSGILFQPGDAIVFQVHYHYEHQATPDQSTVALQVDAPTPDIRPIQIVNPVGPVEIPCMPGTVAELCDRDAALADDARLYGPFGSAVEPALLAICNQSIEQMTLGFAGIATSSCDTKVPESGDIVAAMGHMHTLGKTFRLTLDPGGPNEKVLLDIPAWNFDWQMNYQLQDALHVNAGDTIRMSCSWDRSVDPNRPPKYIVFAEGTEDEMCFSTYALIPDSRN